MTRNIPVESIEQVRLASDIIDVVSGYLTLQKRGRNYFGLCPFHQEKTPSFSVNPEMQIFHCFGCGAGGNVFTFIMKMEGVTFPEAVKLLAQAAGIVLPEDSEDIDQYREKEALFYVNKLANEFFLHNLQKAKEAQEARDYLQNRGILSQMYAQFDLGYALNKWDGLLNHAKTKSIKPEILLKAGLVIQKETSRYYDRFRGRITFSIRNLSNQIIGFGARRLVDDDSPKYINTPETEIYQKRFILYGLHTARESIRRENKIIIVEGYTDFISLNNAGIKNVIATSGTALTEEHARLMRRYTSNAIVMYDSDSAGAAAAMRGADILLENGFEIKICTLPNGQDPDEFVRTHSEVQVKEILEAAAPLIDHKLQVLQKDDLLQTVNQRTSATRELLASIAKIGDQIQRAYLLRDLAKKLHIEESALWNELEKQSKKTRFTPKTDTAPRDSSVSANKFFQSKKGAAELALLEMAVLDPDLIPRILQNIHHDDFSHPEIRRFFQLVDSSEFDPLSFSPENYIATIQDASIASHLSDSFSEKSSASFSWKYASDCLISLQLVQIDEEIERIREEIRQQNKQSKNTSSLVHQFQQLLEQKKLVSKGEFIIS
ncbi:MAG: DNA primase [Actinobacteria bacterium]|nr:DNA primase [Actinomycetota bacterium]